MFCIVFRNTEMKFMESKIRQARKSGDSTVITLSSFAEAGEYFIVQRIGDEIILKKIIINLDAIKENNQIQTTLHYDNKTTNKI